MKKAIFTLAIALMAFGGNNLFAQRSERMARANEMMKQHFQNREESWMAPSVATFTANGDNYQTTYTYDEGEYSLVEALTQKATDNGWQNEARTTYEYGWVDVDTEIFSLWTDGEWVDIKQTSYSYDPSSGMLTECIIENSEDGIDWENFEKRAYTYNNNVITTLYSLWFDNMWNVDQLYTMTVMADRVEILIQDMQGAAWQNSERISYYYFTENVMLVSSIVYELWQNNDWVTTSRQVYHYENGVYTSIDVESKAGGGAWELFGRATFDYENGNAVHGLYQINDEGTWVDNMFDFQMSYNNNEDILEIVASEVSVAYLDLLGVAENKVTSRFGVYPNPAKDLVTVSGEGFEKAEIYNLAGQKVMETTQTSIDVKALSTGIYMMKVFGNGKSDIHRIVVE